VRKRTGSRGGIRGFFVSKCNGGVLSVKITHLSIWPSDAVVGCCKGCTRMMVAHDTLPCYLAVTCSNCYDNCSGAMTTTN